LKRVPRKKNARKNTAGRGGKKGTRVLRENKVLKNMRPGEKKETPYAEKKVGGEQQDLEQSPTTKGKKKK